MKARARPAKVSEEEFVREKLSEATGVHFDVIPPHPGFPLPVEKLDWFMRCRNKEEIKRAPYLNAVWKDKAGPIWLESLAVGDTVDWIELAYGDERASESLSNDYSRWEEPAFRRDFETKFPIVIARVREYEDVVANVAKQKKVKLELRRAGSKGILVFTVAARTVPRKGTKTMAPLGSALQKTIQALREAYDAVVKLED